MKIILLYFLLSMLITVAILYLTNPDPMIIVKYPKLNDNVSDIYTDDNNVCYKYHKEKVKCF